MTRHVTLVLVDGRGSPLGRLPGFDVRLPYWQEVREVVAGARERFGVDVAVLRILSTQPGLARGGDVTYLAEVGGAPEVPLKRAGIALSEHPLRPDYANPGGPGRSLAWARKTLGVPVLTSAQMRTWNLSAIWRLDTAAGGFWLKQVPAFFSHEAAVLSYLGMLFAADQHGRMLLAHVPGEDLYNADLDTRAGIIADHFAIQAKATNDVGQLREAGVPDLRGSRLVERLKPVLDQPWVCDRINRAAACGMPDTLVHGDLHPGNVIGDVAQRTIIDWGDSFLGHPAFDILRMSEDLPDDEAAVLIALWADLWRKACDGCDPEGSVNLLRPVAALRNAGTFADFLANIEPSEHPYHAGDVAYWLEKAIRLDADNI